MAKHLPQMLCTVNIGGFLDTVGGKVQKTTNI